MRWSLIRRYGSSALLITLLVGSFALSWFHLPFVVVQGSSMQPTYETGDLVLVQETNPSNLQEGDIVIVDVPRASEEQYGYPDRIVHRVVEVNSEGDFLGFRTKGDNTGEDPFLVYAENIEGKAGEVYPNVGLIILYLKSIHGRAFLFSVLLIEFSFNSAPLIRRETGEYIDEFIDRHSPSREVEEKIDELDQDTQEIQHSLNHFAEAMDEYATHLESHTEAVQNMAKAADGIHDSVEHQTRVLAQISQQTALEASDSKARPMAEMDDSRTNFDWIEDVADVAESDPSSEVAQSNQQADDAAKERDGSLEVDGGSTSAETEPQSGEFEFDQQLAEPEQKTGQFEFNQVSDR